jgi:hypothetical protein
MVLIMQQFWRYDVMAGQRMIWRHPLSSKDSEWNQLHRGMGQFG